MSEEKPVPVKKRVIRHLTSTQKAEAIALWRAGTHTLDDLAKRYKKDRTTLLNLFKKEGAQKGAAEAETIAKVQAEVEKAMTDDVTVLAQRIRDTKEEHYKLASGIVKLSSHIVTQARQEKRPMATVLNDMKALKLWAETLKITREERYAVLGISADDDNADNPLPDLVVQELTVEDIKKMHSLQMVEADDLDGLEIAELGDEELLAEMDDDLENGRVETE